MNQAQNLNFCIIAHIDHGKSTLADRLLEITHTVEPRQMKAQVLDRMELERERGITIKLQPVRMRWLGHSLNLIDTPGHVDFTYEVSRSLAACEGALLVVDATQGIQAQTLANVYMALDAGLRIIPIVNKIDLPAAQTERVASELAQFLGSSVSDVHRVSAKTGAGVEDLLSTIIAKVPAPSGQPQSPLRALIFDSVYDDYRGVLLYVRIFDGQLSARDEITLMAPNSQTQALEVGYFQPDLKSAPELISGQIGYIVTNLHGVEAAQVGDTVTQTSQPATTALVGYRPAKPFVYAGVFPASAEQYQQFKEALAKLKLNDAALFYEPENSPVFGFGFRMGFLGLLHLDIVKERLEREYGVELIVTNPSSEYRVRLTDGSELELRSASMLPEASKIKEIQEPWVKGEILTPKSYLGNAMQLVNQNRGRIVSTKYIDEIAIADFEAPLSKVLTDFYDSLKSTTSGYGSLSYDLLGFRIADLVRLDILVATEPIESLSTLVHKDEAAAVGRAMVARLKAAIPRQLFEVTLQAAVGGKILARDDIKPVGKNVTAHLYGGDITRKRKLWEKQKAGKSRMKKFGKVEIPAEAFMALLKKE